MTEACELTCALINIKVENNLLPSKMRHWSTDELFRKQLLPAEFKGLFTLCNEK